MRDPGRELVGYSAAIGRRLVLGGARISLVDVENARLKASSIVKIAMLGYLFNALSAFSREVKKSIDVHTSESAPIGGSPLSVWVAVLPGTKTEVTALGGSTWTIWSAVTVRRIVSPVTGSVDSTSPTVSRIPGSSQDPLLPCRNGFGISWPC